MLGFVGNGGFHKFLAIIATFVIVQVVIKPYRLSNVDFHGSFRIIEL